MTAYTLDGRPPEDTQSGRREIAMAVSLVGCLAKLRNAIRNRRSVRQLLDWDDRTLGDIGLTRGDVVSAMSGSINDDPGYRLSLLAGERRRADRAAARERLNAIDPRRLRIHGKSGGDGGF